MQLENIFKIPANGNSSYVVRTVVNFLKTEWEKDKYASKLKDNQLFFVNEERCYLFTRWEVCHSMSY